MKQFIRRLPSIRPPVLILGGAVLIAIVLIVSRPRDIPVERPERAWVVDVIHVEKRTLRPTLEIFGSVQSPQDTELSAGIDSLVMQVPVRDGESVEGGQALVLLDGRDAELTMQQQQADVLEIEAQMDFGKRRLERSGQALQREQELLELTKSRADRAAELAKEGLLSQADLDTSSENLKRQELAVNQAELEVEESQIRMREFEAQLTRARALREQARLDVERATIAAPFPGVISDLTVSVGDRVRKGDPLMRLQNPAAIEVRAQIPARYADAVSDGLANALSMPVQVENGDQTIAAEIVRISGQTREGSGGVDTFIGFATPPLGLRLGSTVRVLLDLPPEDNVIAVPAESLYGRNRLYKLVDDRMQMIDVDPVGDRALPDGRTEVIIRSSLLTNNDRVIVTKLANAADGLLVRVAGAGPTRAAGRPAPSLPLEDPETKPAEKL